MNVWQLLGQALFLAQAGGAAEGGAAGAGGAAGGAADGGPFGFLGGMGGLLPILLIGVIFYFLLIRPERAKRAEMDRMLKALKKNDRVVTAGGIVGLVANIQENAEFVTLRVDEATNTKLRILRSSITRVLAGEEGADKSESKDDG